MRKPFIIFIFLLCGVAAEAQNSTTSYYFTRTSEQYLTDAEVDSFYLEETKQFLLDNSIPEEYAETTIPMIKRTLEATSRPGIVQSFIKLERENKIKSTADNSSPQFSRTKALYMAVLQEQVQKAFSSKPALSKYTTLNDNDRITSFNSTVRVGTDGKLLVREDITVYNGNGQSSETGPANNEIKRGIVRAFPLYYINKNKLFQNTTFKLKAVLKDGEKENYHTDSYENGILVYTGSSDVFLRTGTFHYSIIYETDHQLKMLKDFDELYWNVTGNSWSFRIDSAMCTVILPAGANVLSSKCYTGAQGATGEDCNISSYMNGDSAVIVFKTTKALRPNTGVTIATSWQKGIVSAPSAAKQIWYYIWNNKAVFFLPMAALFSAIFCFIFWFRYGRDPKKGVIYPLFEPPAGFSPASLGYILNQRFSNELTAATMVDAAVRNKIKIDVERDGLIFKHNEYVIRAAKEPIKPAASRYADFEADVKKLIGTRIEKGKYNSGLEKLNTKLKDFCESNYKNKDGKVNQTGRGFFALNNKYTILPVIVCLVAAGWGFFGGVIKSFQLANFWQIGYFIAGLILCVIFLKVFAKLLSAYNPEGRALVDKIEGFRMFLSTADEKRFDMMSPPKKSLELYEKYLPFAIALKCEIAWSEKFEDIIKTAIIGGAVASSFSQSFVNDSQNFSSAFASSFSGAISSASTPPSSSSDGGSSFSGGSSGGGGGGGGGGGW